MTSPPLLDLDSRRLPCSALSSCTYAAIRPRFGAGAQTAIYAGFVVPRSNAVLFGFTMMGMMTRWDVRERIHRDIVSTLAASVAGASI